MQHIHFFQSMKYKGKQKQKKAHFLFHYCEMDVRIITASNTDAYITGNITPEQKNLEV